jgi:hypothetical protein
MNLSQLQHVYSNICTRIGRTPCGDVCGKQQQLSRAAPDRQMLPPNYKLYGP